MKKIPTCDLFGSFKLGGEGRSSIFQLQALFILINGQRDRMPLALHSSGTRGVIFNDLLVLGNGGLELCNKANNMPPPLSGTVLKKKWKLGALVGTGGCAEVYEATDVARESAGARPLVAKIAPLPVGLPPAMNKGKKRKKTDQEKHADMIYYEYTLYKGFLLGHDGVVEVRLPAENVTGQYQQLLLLFCLLAK